MKLLGQKIFYPELNRYNQSFSTKKTYADRVLGVAPNNLIGYWPLWEASGNIARNYGLGGTARDGAITGGLLNQQPGIGDGHGCYVEDGSGDFVNVYSASLAVDFNGAEGTIIAWAMVAAASVWEDAAFRILFLVGADGTQNYAMIRKINTNNTITFTYEAGNTVDIVSAGSQTSTGWVPYAMTWSKAANEMKAYIAGAQTGATQGALGVYVGTLADNFCSIGAVQNPTAQVWNGSLAHVALWNVALTPTQIFYLSRV